MAKKTAEVNKSQAIRNMLAEHPKAKASEIVTLLGQKGIKVSDNLVYLVKAKGKAAKRRQKRAKAMANSQQAGVANPVELIRAVKVLAERAGGLRQLKQLVDILAE